MGLDIANMWESWEISVGFTFGNFLKTSHVVVHIFAI